MTWQEALDWILLLNTTGIACTDYTPMTYQNWRLPNIKELRSLVDHGQSNPSLPLGHPFVSVQLDLYYSSSTFVHPYRSDAWAVSMEWGDDRNALKMGDLFVWPVRGGQ